MKTGYQLLYNFLLVCVHTIAKLVQASEENLFVQVLRLVCFIWVGAEVDTFLVIGAVVLFRIPDGNRDYRLQWWCTLVIRSIKLLVITWIPFVTFISRPVLLTPNTI